MCFDDRVTSTRGGRRGGKATSEEEFVRSLGRVDGTLCGACRHVKKLLLEAQIKWTVGQCSGTVPCWLVCPQQGGDLRLLLLLLLACCSRDENVSLLSWLCRGTTTSCKWSSPPSSGGVDECYTIVRAQEGGKRRLLINLHRFELTMTRLSAVLVSLTHTKYRQARLREGWRVTRSVDW